jgi:hypothetical protein
MEKPLPRFHLYEVYETWLLLIAHEIVRQSMQLLYKEMKFQTGSLEFHIRQHKSHDIAVEDFTGSKWFRG